MGTITGTNGADRIIPGWLSAGVSGVFAAGGSVVLALGGNDAVQVLDGSNTVFGGDGDDNLYGAEGPDTLYGEAGDDWLDSGVGGLDVLDGGAGNDTLYLLNGTVVATGGIGADIFRLGGPYNSDVPPSLSAIPLITDFQPLQGDRLGFDGFPPGSLFAGDADRAVAFGGVLTARSALVAGASLAPVPTGFDLVQVFWIPVLDAPAGWMVTDLNRNGLLDQTDYAVRVATPDPAAFSLAWFAADAFAILGTASGDVLDARFALAYAVVAGGPGNDTYLVGEGSFYAPTPAVRELADGGVDTVISWAYSYALPENVEIGRLAGTGYVLSGSNAADQLVANPTLASNLFGGRGDDVLWGGLAASTLDGGEGDDILRSQGAADMMIGGTGNDQFVVANPNAVVQELLVGGFDTAWVAVSGWIAPANIEVVRLIADNAVVLGSSARDVLAAAGLNATLDGRAGDDELWGSAGRDVLLGGAGDDILRSQGGADTLIGAAGNDQYTVFDAGAAVQESAGEGYDMAYVTVDGWAMGPNIEVGLLSGAARHLVGSATGENLVGNPLAGSTLSGGGGNDILWGSAHADTFAGGAQDDVIYSYGGADRFVFDAPGWGNDFISGYSRADGARIDLRGSGLTSFAQFVVEQGDDTRLTAPDGSTIYIYNVTGFAAADFIFA